MRLLTLRHRQAEWMDQPDLDDRLHRQALGALSRINRLSGIAGRLWREIDEQCSWPANRPLGVLDVACGGGDTMRHLARRAAAASRNIVLTGYDISSTAIEYAAQQSERPGCCHLPLHFRRVDALNDPWPEQFDVVYCTLFLHHLDAPDALRLLRKMRDHARQLVLVDDLRRTRIGYAMAWLGCRLLTRSPVVHRDGPLSVQGALTSEEARQLAAEAGMPRAEIKQHWPQRFLLSCRCGASC